MYRGILKIGVFQFMIYLTVVMITAFIVFGSWGNTIRNVVILLTTLVALMSQLTRDGLKIKFYRGSYLLWFILFTIYSFISLIWCTNLSSAATSLINLVMAVCLGLSIKLYLDKENVAGENLLDCFVIGVVIASIYCIVRENISLLSWARLGQSEFEVSGETSIYFTCCIILATFILIYRLFNTDKKVLYGVLLCFIYVCGILTGVRKCMIIPFVFFFVYIIVVNRKHLLRTIVFISLGILLAIIVYILILRYSTSMAYRISSLLQDLFAGDVVSSGYSESMDSYQIRRWLRNLSWQLFLNHPLKGYGIGQFRVYSLENGGPYLYSHNNWLELLSCTGIIGFVIYYIGVCTMGFVSAAKIRVEKNIKKIRTYSFVIASIITIIVMEYGQVTYYYLMFVFMFVVLDALTRQKDSI